MKLDEYLDDADLLEATKISSWRKSKEFVIELAMIFALPFILLGLFLHFKIRDRRGDPSE